MIGLSRVKSRKITDRVTAKSSTPMASGASEASSGIGLFCPSCGSVGISTVTAVGAGGSRGGRL